MNGGFMYVRLGEMRGATIEDKGWATGAFRTRQNSDESCSNAWNIGGDIL